MGLFDKLKDAALGVKSTHTENGLTYFSTEEAKARFEKLCENKKIFLDCYNEFVGTKEFQIAFDYLAKGDIRYIDINWTHKYDSLEDDNLLKFFNEYVNAYEEANGIDSNLRKFSLGRYYVWLGVMVIVVSHWENDSTSELDYSYPNCLNVEKNPFLKFILLFEKNMLICQNAMNDECIDDVFDFGIKALGGSGKNIIEKYPWMFEPAIYRDYDELFKKVTELK